MQPTVGTRQWSDLWHATSGFAGETKARRDFAVVFLYKFSSNTHGPLEM